MTVSLCIRQESKRNDDSELDWSGIISLILITVYTDKLNIHFNAMRDDADRESFGAGL